MCATRLSDLQRLVEDQPKRTDLCTRSSVSVASTSRSLNSPANAILPTRASHTLAQLRFANRILFRDMDHILATLDAHRSGNDKTRRRALAWRFFTLEETGEGYSRAHCILCENVSYKLGPRAGTTNLLKHVQADHLEAYNELVQRESGTAQKPKRPLEDGSTYSRSHPKQQKFNRALIETICSAHLPFSFVENTGFKKLVALCDHRLSVPCRATASTRLLDETSLEIRNHSVDPVLQDATSGCLSYDLWQSVMTSDVCGLIFTVVQPDFEIKEVFLGLVESFSTTGVAVAEDVLNKLTEFGLQSKVIGICIDGGANLAKSARELQSVVESPFGSDVFFDSRCISHSISLCCSNAMKADPIIAEAKQAVNKCITWTRNTRRGSLLWKRACEEMGLPVKKLVKAVTTRFASQLASFKSILEYRIAVVHLSTSLAATNEDAVPSALLWEVISVVYLKYSALLSRAEFDRIEFDRCKRVMETLLIAQSSGSNCMLSTVLFHLITLYISIAQSDHDEATEYLNQLGGEWCGGRDEDLAKLWVLNDRLQENIQQSLKRILEPFRTVEKRTSHFWLSLMLDPRMKRLKILRSLEAADESFRVQEQVLTVEEEILMKLLVKAYFSLHPSESPTDDGDVSDGDFPHYRMESRSRSRNRVESMVMEEYLKFRTAPVQDMAHCPLLWHKMMQSRYPNIAELAKGIFAIPPSQSSVERIFSVAGHVHNKRRNRLAVQKLEKIMFVNEGIKGRGWKDYEAFISSEIELLEESQDLSDESTDP